MTQLVSPLPLSLYVVAYYPYLYITLGAYTLHWGIKILNTQCLACTDTCVCVCVTNTDGIVNTARPNHLSYQEASTNLHH